MAAQSFPWDFDGILAGDAVLAGHTNAMHWLWAQRVLTAEAGVPLLGQADLELPYRAVMAHCDLNDGVKDGLLGDPRACAFDPVQATCASQMRAPCLTDGQVKAVKRIYSSPVSPGGGQLYLPVAMKGSELGWGFKGLTAYAEDWFRYLTFEADPGPAWQQKPL